MKIATQMYKTYEHTIRNNKIINALQKQVLKNQFIFLTYPSEEMLYGGMAGGGKTEALLLSALQYVEEKYIPIDSNKLTYNALILRRTLDDLEMPNAILDRAKQWLLPLENTGLVTYKDIKKQFRFSSGATLTFRYLAHDNDLMKYQGAELQFIGFDELTQFKENQYTYLHSRLRKTEDNPIPLRMRGASNPGGIGHDWVKNRFVKQGSELPFVPSSYLDNKYLDHEDYSKQLDKLDPVTRAQLKYGDWDIVLNDGLLCNMNQLKKQLIKPEVYNNWTPNFCTIGIDPASTGEDSFAMSCLVNFTNDKTVLVDIDSTSNSNPEHIVNNFINRNLKWKPYVINFEREPGSSPKYALEYWRQLLNPVTQVNGIIVKDTPASQTGSKYMRATPHANLVRNEELYFNENLLQEHIESNPLRKLFNQYIYVHPDKSVMKDYPSPDELDSVGYAYVVLNSLIKAGLRVY